MKWEGGSEQQQRRHHEESDGGRSVVVLEGRERAERDLALKLKRALHRFSLKPKAKEGCLRLRKGVRLDSAACLRRPGYADGACLRRPPPGEHRQTGHIGEADSLLPLQTRLVTCWHREPACGRRDCCNRGTFDGSVSEVK
jgi:hypothetical protein